MSNAEPYTFSSTLWKPQLRGLLKATELLAAGKKTCLFAPTGGGKTTQAFELLKWAWHSGIPGIFYVNRRLLIGQTYQRFVAGGLHCGIRAADYEDCYDYDAPIQIASADTERARVFNSEIKKNIWEPHKAGLVIIDEGHLQKTQTMRQIMDYYQRQDAMIVCLTATPVEMADWYDEIVISGRLAEYRECNALVPAVVKSIEQPDVSKVKRNHTGEFIFDGKAKQIYTQTIVGNVIAKWKEFNPYARPTMLFAPGKEESVWFADQFEKIGVPWAHVDATECVIDGVRRSLTRPAWDEIVERYKDGSIKGLSCRFKLREGIDLPSTYHAILATPIGSLASYIQTVGRVLRYSPETPDEVLITDHGGNYWRHGSPNIDRDWKRWWNLPEKAVSEWHLERIRDGKEQEPIRCPNCSTERRTGITCPKCNHTHEKSKRKVVMEDGRIIELDGDLVKPRKITMKPNTQRDWDKFFFAYVKGKKDQTFNQMYAYFQHEKHYAPPRDLPNMPMRPEHWYMRVCDVDRHHLYNSNSSPQAEGASK